VGIKRFEDIQAWQEARKLTAMIYELSSGEKFGKDFGLRDQIRRAAVSAMANIVEGFGRRTKKEFSHFLNVAHGSVLEAQSHLYVALDLGYIDEKKFKKVYEQSHRTSRLIGGFINYLHPQEKNEKRGTRNEATEKSRTA